jgi:cytosine/uracil/thiamine/allantoin permease
MHYLSYNELFAVKALSAAVIGARDGITGAAPTVVTSKSQLSNFVGGTVIFVFYYYLPIHDKCAVC